MQASPQAAGAVPGAASGTINVSRLIDDGPVSPVQVAAMVMCGLVAFLDGMDSQSIAVGVPLIVGELGLAKSSIGPILSSALLGAMVGAMTFGPLGDRFGRKQVLVAAACVFGVFTVLTAYAASLPTLLVVRFMAGLGLGGATPCFLALASEYAPGRRRAMVASLIWAAFPLGATAGGFVNSYILRVSDWRTMFLAGGAAPLVVAVVLALFLPESIRFLLARRGDGTRARALAIVRRIAPAVPPGTTLLTDEERAEGVPLVRLFTEGRAPLTLLLWVPFVAAFGTLAIVAYWTPALLRDAGMPASDTAIVLGVQSIGSILGMGSAGRLMERFGATPVLVSSLVLGAAATGLIGFATGSVASVSAMEAVSCFFVGMGASGSIALASLVYPTALRSSGIGWAMGMGRGGQVCFTLLTGVFVSGGWGSTAVFLVVGVAPAVGALGALLIHACRQAAPVPAVA